MNGSEHFDVLIVGAGLSGIGAAHHLSSDAPWAKYAIFEGRNAIGGTWDLFRYPGIRSDSDMFTMGYPFRPWAGEKAIADGDSIRDYITDTAKEDGTDAHIRFNHQVQTAEWSSADAIWRVTSLRTDTGETIEVTCGFLFCCTGYYRYDRGYFPDFPGLSDFGGPVIHPQHWPTDLDYDGKKVVIIGSGATAVTLVPAMAARAGHVTMLQRSPSYIASVPGRNPLARLQRDRQPSRVASTVIRWLAAVAGQAMYQYSRRRPEAVKRLLRRGAERALPAGYDIDTHFTPTYNPWDQRMCLIPDGDLFEAIKAGTASVVTDHIEMFTSSGLRLKSGRQLDADIAIVATGLELLFLGGIEVRVDGEAIAVSEKLVYKAMMLDGVPNLAFAFGYTNASWTLRSDLVCRSVARVVSRMRAAGQRQCVASCQDEGMDRSPMLGLTSGYVQRSVERFPKHGSGDPWKVHQNYLLDYKLLRLGPVEDGVLRFSRPSSTPSPDAVDLTVNSA